MNEGTITISKKEYDRLVLRDKLLSALEAGGVDNWEGYSDSISERFLEDSDESEDLDDPEDVS